MKRMILFLLMLIVFWLISCEKERKFHQQPLNWKVRSFEGGIGYEHKDTTITHEYRHTYSPTLKRELKL